MTLERYCVIGLMSGTSLDGLDLAYCAFQKTGNGWDYHILQAETIPYPKEWHTRLSTLESGTALEFASTDAAYGHLIGKYTREFMERHHLKPDFIASHGHTIFHQPQNRFTTQIGKGAAIAAETGIHVVSDFRSLDVALGGQGAPLVPIGDRLLFPDYAFCLNLGGFANISFEQDGNRIAFDICPVNIVLNKLASEHGLAFDPDGQYASRGSVDRHLLDRLNSLSFYQKLPPKSLGKEWVIEAVLPLLDLDKYTVNELLATFCEHIALQVAHVVPGSRMKKLLITGGGAFNTYLIGRIREHIGVQIILPDILTINYKEALIFAFLGVLRWRNEVNCLKSVTGAVTDSAGGAVN